MEIKGKITKGYGKGAYFLDKDFYKLNFHERCGFTPFPGTLNIIVPEEKLKDIEKLKMSCNNIIKPEKGFGGVKYIKAILEDSVTGAIVFPDKTSHEENYLEFIAKDYLRKKLYLKDGDFVNLRIDID